MTNTKFRKRALLSSVAMLLVALVALGSATFAWFTTSRSATAEGLKLKSTASSGIVIQSESMKKAGEDFGKTTILNAKMTGDDKGTADDTAIVLEPASFIGTFSGTTDKVPKFASTKSDDPGASRKGDNMAVSSITPSSDQTNGPLKTTIYSEKVYIKSTGDATDVYVTGVTVTQNSSSTAKAEVKAAVYALVTDASGRILYLGNSAGSAPSKYLTVDSGTISFPSDGTLASGKESDTALSTDCKLTSQVTSDGTDYVWVCLFLDGENANVYTQNVDAKDLISSVTVNFSMDAPSGYGS